MQDLVAGVKANGQMDQPWTMSGGPPAFSRGNRVGYGIAARTG